jgi:hypothetical protein
MDEPPGHESLQRQNEQQQFSSSDSCKLCSAPSYTYECQHALPVTMTLDEICAHVEPRASGRSTTQLHRCAWTDWMNYRCIEWLEVRKSPDLMVENHRLVIR